MNFSIVFSNKNGQDGYSDYVAGTGHSGLCHTLSHTVMVTCHINYTPDTVSTTDVRFLIVFIQQNYVCISYNFCLNKYAITLCKVSGSIYVFIVILDINAKNPLIH